MDKIDVEILKMLCKDARTSFSKIGQKLGVGTDTVIRRFKKLKRDGKILGATVVLSSKTIGIKGWAGLYLKIKNGSSLKVVKDKIISISQIYTFSQILGEYDFYLEVGFRNFEEINVFVSELMEIKEIVVIDTVFYDSHDWPLPTLTTLDPEILSWLLNDKTQT